MQLIKVWIDGYKHLRNTCVYFNETVSPAVFSGALPIRFFIGLNGSGKSVFLEGICFLFSRIAQNEAPGFRFSLVYRILRDIMFQVEVTNGAGEEPLDILVTSEGEGGTQRFHTFEGRRDLLPDYVFTCASGSNNNYFDIMVRSPRTSLYSDLFDMSLLGKSRLDNRQKRRNVERMLVSLKELEENPISLFVDEENSVLVLAALLAVLPGTQGSEAMAGYIKFRREILEMVDSMPEPVLLSFTLDAGRGEELGDVLWQGRGHTGTPVGSGWSTTRLYQYEAADMADGHGDRVISFLFEPCVQGDKDSFAVGRLNALYDSPMELLSKLVLARNKGIIKEAHIGFQIQNTADLVEENAFSEGEYMLLVRLGLFLLERERKSRRQCLFLMDEPDVYLNEHWNIDFVSMIHRIYEGEAADHEVVIATHSSLMLTDAFPNQLYYFQQRQGQVTCLNIRASTFGGSRNEIMERLFLTDSSVGTYSCRTIERILDEVDDIEQLERYLKDVGSGYLRLRMLDKIRLLKKKEG